MARLYSGRLNLPPLEMMVKWERETAKQKGGVKRKFHVLPFPEDGEYINRLLDWAAEADAAGATRPSDAMHTCGLSTDISSARTDCMSDCKTIGKIRPKWGKREYWIRERFTNIRKAFLERGEQRHGIRTLEELGFRFHDEDADGEEAGPKEARKL